MPDTETPVSHKPVPLSHHLTELRKAILYPVILWGVFVVVGLVFQKQVVDALLYPVEKGIGWALRRNPNLPRLGVIQEDASLEKNILASPDGSHYVLRGDRIHQGRADGSPGWDYSLRLPATAVALSPDGRYLAVTLRDGPLVLLAAATGRPEWEDSAADAESLQFTADSQTLLVARQGGEVVGLALDKKVRFSYRIPSAESASSVRPINVGPLDVFMVIMKAAFIFGLLPAVPYLIYCLWKFTKPGLLPHEQAVVGPLMWFLVALFFSGALFAYFAVMPVLTMFLYELNAKWAVVLWDIRHFADLTLILMFAFGIVFEMPLVIILITQLRFVSPDTLSSQRKVIWLVVFILSAIFTPGPDPFSQCMLALPTILLFEAGLYVSRQLLRRQERRAG